MLWARDSVVMRWKCRWLWLTQQAVGSLNARLSLNGTETWPITVARRKKMRVTMSHWILMSKLSATKKPKMLAKPSWSCHLAK